MDLMDVDREIKNCQICLGWLIDFVNHFLQVHIGLTQGSVELENLKLREDALENFNLPFKIIDG